MNRSHMRDLDLNLLRVFVVVATAGSVTAAAAELYLTQSAVSAALRRLTDAIGSRLFVRQGRGIALTARGRSLLAAARPHLEALLEATLAPAPFRPETSERTLRLGLSDATEGWLLPRLLGVLAAEAPRMRVIVLPVQFRTVGETLAEKRVDLAVTVADELPAGTRRKALFSGEFVCVFDPRQVRVHGRLRERDYFAREHVVVSYNGDLRGVVEDMLGKTRRVRCSVPSFASLGAIIDGSALLATVPAVVAEQIRTGRPHLQIARLPFSLPLTPLEMLWPAAAEDDPVGRFLRGHVERIADAVTGRRRP